MARRFNGREQLLKPAEFVNRKLHQCFVDDGIIPRGNVFNRLAGDVNARSVGDGQIVRHNFIGMNLRGGSEIVSGVFD